MQIFEITWNKNQNPVKFQKSKFNIQTIMIRNVSNLSNGIWTLFVICELIFVF